MHMRATKHFQYVLLDPQKKEKKIKVLISWQNFNLLKQGQNFGVLQTTCVNMCQVKLLESFKGGYHPIISHHNHSNSMLARKVNHYNS